MKYRGNKLKYVPEGDWISENRWIYLGSEDPYCYVEVAYDIWWLQGKAIKSIAYRNSTRKVVYTRMHKVESGVEFLQVRVVEDCLGIRGSRRMITHRKDWWHRIHRFVPKKRAVTIHEPLLAIIESNQVVQISGTYESESLWFDGTKFHNVELASDFRTWIKLHWITVQRVKHLDSLLILVTWLGGNEMTTYEVPKRDIKTGQCATLLTVEQQVFIIGEEYYTTKTAKIGKISLSCGPHLSQCNDMHR